LSYAVNTSFDTELYSFDPSATDLYYSDQWQVLEERQGDETTAQYVWSPVYVNAMVLRDRDSDSDADLDERLYPTQDANFNITSVVDTNGDVVERFAYDPYGKRTVLAEDWSAIQDGLDFHHGFQGGKEDAATGLINFQRRDYDTSLQQWSVRDVVYFDSANLYSFTRNSPVGHVDPTGRQGFATGYWGGNGGPSHRPRLTDPDGEQHVVPPPNSSFLRHWGSAPWKPGECIIEIYWTKVGLGYHATVVITNADGTQDYVRAGAVGSPSSSLSTAIGSTTIGASIGASAGSIIPGAIAGSAIGVSGAVIVAESGLSGLGNIQGESGAYIPGSRDWVPPSDRVNEGAFFRSPHQCDCDAKLKAMQAYVDAINASGIPYHPLSDNSNSFAAGALEAAGLDPGYPVTDIIAPGYGDPMYPR
jgi:RHS repeat-associated protein